MKTTSALDILECWLDDHHIWLKKLELYPDRYQDDYIKLQSSSVLNHNDYMTVSESEDGSQFLLRYKLYNKSRHCELNIHDPDLFERIAAIITSIAPHTRSMELAVSTVAMWVIIIGALLTL